MSVMMKPSPSPLKQLRNRLSANVFDSHAHMATDGGDQQDAIWGVPQRFETVLEVVDQKVEHVVKL